MTTPSPGTLEPALRLELPFVLDGRGRMVSTREPNPTRPPALVIVRSATGRAWALRDDVDDDLAATIAALAATEPPGADVRAAPAHAARYVALLGGEIDAGPDFVITEGAAPAGVVEIADERPLRRYHPGWIDGELAAGCAPAFAILDGDDALSVCFCARRTDTAAAAGVYTGAPFRGRGLAAQVTAAWAAAIRASGRTALYGTSWTNAASLAVARKLGLVAVAGHWSIGGRADATRAH